MSQRDVLEVSQMISDCDLRIAIQHHPLDWLHEYDERSCRELFHEKFNINLHGHTHIYDPSQNRRLNGSLVTIGSGCLYQTYDYQNSVSFVELAVGETHFDCDVSIYVSSNGAPFSQLPSREGSSSTFGVRRLVEI